jgi:uncharacterized membrane protein YdjX (TVP38/TMEM64 family)
MSNPMQHWPLTTGMLIMLVALALVLVLGALGVDQVFNLLQAMESAIERDFVLILTVFIASFAVLAVLALPIGSLYCLAAGYLFGLWLGSAAALVGASIAAAVTFALVRRFGGLGMRQRLAQSRVEPLLKLLERDATWYLILFRIIPLAPFFVVNAAAGMARISAWHFNLATLAGLVPTTIIYAAVGNGLGSMLDARDLAGPELLLQPTIGLPLLALVALIVLTFLVRQRMARKIDES